MNQSMKEGLLIAVALGLALIAAEGVASGYTLKNSANKPVIGVQYSVADDVSAQGAEASPDAALAFNFLQ
ncbi:MAG: hypothetical protein H0V62_14570 [Gammaproteobacteria bacterium]|nr:hypothetical protein [Gammaproteobacteria bacterium]